MFRHIFSRPLLSSVKESTGIVGLDVVPNARSVLIGLYNDMLTAVQSIPDTAKYRKDVEKVTNYRLRVCEEEENWEKIEKRIGCGQVEELICQAKDEMTLIPKMAEWKPWEVSPDHKIAFVEEDDQVPSHVPKHIQ